ncbi:hypothetical protein Tco_0284979 [Tanacetum coccineum]
MLMRRAEQLLLDVIRMMRAFGRKCKKGKLLNLWELRKRLDQSERILQVKIPDKPKSKNVKIRVNTEESAVKPEPELKNTIGCNLNPSDGPGKPNSITMKTVKTLKAQS